MSDEPALIEQAFRYELDVSAEQREFLESCLGASRFWFNQGLALVKARLDERVEDEDVRVPWSYHALCSSFRGDQVKDDLAPWRSEVVIGSYQAGLEALGNALQAFSRGRSAGRNVGFPRFRSKHNPAHQSAERVLFQNPRIPDARHVMLDRRLGPIRAKESLRKLTRLIARDPEARILRATVKRSGDGYAIAFSVRRSRALKARTPRRPREVIGIDLGLTTLATLSTGETVPNDRPLREALQRLKRLQRKLDRQRRANNPGNYDAKGRARKGVSAWHVSTRMRETERQIRRCHQRVRNLRANRTHALTTWLTREYGIIGVESLAVSNMMGNRRLARAIADAGWGEILRQLQYKSDWSGDSLLVQADRFHPSSKTCAGCGAVKAKLLLSQRVFTCVECGHEDDRDVNAARNLAALALQAAQTEGITGARLARPVAVTSAPTGGARGGPTGRGQVRDTMKREGPSGSSRSRKAPALAVTA